MLKIQELKNLTSDLNVLYVEDDASIQMGMEKYLKKFFASVTLASNGVEGLNLYKKESFDIVITDLSMPKMNGSDMIVKIREFDTDVSIIITTAYVESNYLIEAIRAHVDGYIIKPFEYTLLNEELFKVAQKIQNSRENRAYKLHLTELINEQTQQMRENYEKSIYSMVDLIEQRDTYTAGHSKRVSYYCNLIATMMGYSKEEITLLRQAAILHDIGKIETPDAVLLKPEKLTKIEYTLIQEHVSVGYNFLNNIPMFKDIAKIMYQHHERYDGSGYPNGIKGDAIYPLARILIIADAFDAMITNRIYKGRKTTAEALDELLSLSAKQFDPEVVRFAVVALKDVHIEENISQLPKTKLEEERFAYFYKDTLSEIYNQNYLDVVLSKNVYEKKYNTILLFFVHGFSKFNVKNGWEKGDTLLREFAQTLDMHFSEDLVFRIFGDDFAVLRKDGVQNKGVVKVIDKLMEQNKLSYTMKTIDLNESKISKLSDLSFLRH